jgi:DNA-binding NarL/FixJ family response regulator
MIRLLIADDHQIVREGLKYVVSQCRDIRVVGEAADADTAIEIARHSEADVVLLDVSMPGPGVLDVIRHLKRIRQRLRILVLSVHPETQYARRVLMAGADGYLTKTHSSQALASAIRQVHGGRKYVTPSLAEELALDLSHGREGRRHEALSNREYEVFLRLGAGEGVDHIATGLRLSPKTVRTYRSRILEKTDLKSTAEIIFYAISEGLVTEVADRSPAGAAPPKKERLSPEERRSASPAHPAICHSTPGRSVTPPSGRTKRASDRP